MRKTVVLFAAGSALSLAVLAGLAGAARLSSGDYISHVRYLASDELKGRGDGTPELDKAAEYLAKHFRQYGAKPVQGNSYFQDFQLTTSAKLGAASRLEYNHHQLRLQQDFVPLNLSSSGQLAGEVVFAGYGITAPEYHYDDYSGIDVHGKVVLVLRHEPQEFDEKSVFAGKSYTVHSQLFSKSSNAKMHGAAAVVLVNDTTAHPSDDDKLEKFGVTAGPEDSGIEFVQVSRQVADDWVSSAGKNLNELENAIDKDLKPRSFALAATLTLRGMVDVERVVKTVHNVVAYYPGASSKEYVIVGAHYDHLGMGGQYSLAPSVTAIHPGADDNASGAAGLLELARNLQGKPAPPRGVLFISFAGEELGLLGSNYYVNHPELPLADAVAMINMDMIGRIRDHKVYVGGSGTGTTFGALVKQEDGSKHGIVPDFTERAGYGSSDHQSFTSKQIPTLFFFSGLHADYHRPSDTWDKIDPNEAVNLLAYVGDIVNDLASEPGRPQFVRVSEPPSASGASAGSGSGYGPYFGSIPDFTEIPNGVRFADVRPGSPAAKAGLRAGDILTEFGGKPIQNLYDFTYALRSHKPGEEIVVKVLRENQPLEVKVLLTERK